MAAFKVVGGQELRGEIEPQGAKNEALQIVASSVLVQNIKIVNCPNIADIRNLVMILENAGAKIKWELGSILESQKNVLTIDTRSLQKEYFESEEYFALSEKLRGSLMLMGPLLARYGVAYIPPVGGDKIGLRPVDTHIQGFVKLGATLDGNKLSLDQNKKISGEILLDDASVTGTANIIMCAALSADNLTVYNAACETYITQLCSALKNMGLRVEGEKSNRITLKSIEGENNFSEPVTHTVLPDFIEVASFIALAMSTRSEITIRNAEVASLGMTLQMFTRLGCKFEIMGDDIRVLKQDRYEIQKMYDGSMMKIACEPWPKVSPDILSVGIVAAVQGDGVVLFHEKMYEARMFFVDKLIAMGAQIVLCDPHRVVVTGNNWKSKLRARHMTSPDIRAGIALLIAALGAEGESVIENIEQIDRGYENIETRLAALGANIQRIN
jgi:UDP-N-acetylglucosamine 1-carboxyvinyltransferase